MLTFYWMIRGFTDSSRIGKDHQPPAEMAKVCQFSKYYKLLLEVVVLVQSEMVKGREFI